MTTIYLQGLSSVLGIKINLELTDVNANATLCCFTQVV